MSPDSSDLIPDQVFSNTQSGTPSGGSSDLIPPGVLTAPTRPIPAKMTPAQHAAFLQQSDQPVQAQTPFGYTLGAGNEWAGNKLAQGAQFLGMTDPKSLQAVRNIPQAVETVFGPRVLNAAVRGAKGLISGGAQEAAPVESPYSQISAGQQERYASVQARGAQLGIKLPEAGSSADEFNAAAQENIPALEAAYRRELNLPEDAPVSKQMTRDFRRQFGEENSYATIRGETALPLKDDAIDAVSSLPEKIQQHLGVDKKIAPNGNIGGNNVMNLWSDLKDMASDRWDAYGDSSLTEHKMEATQLDNAAAAVKDSITSHLENTGRGDVAAQLSQDSKVFAKSYAYEAAMKGKHLDPAKLVRQYAAGAPMDGDMATIAELAEDNPEAFRLSRIGKPTIGPVRRAVAGFAPTLAAGAGALGGSILGPIGTATGAVGGGAVGEGIKNALLR